jgi:hypothetical protein
MRLKTASICACYRYLILPNVETCKAYRQGAKGGFEEVEMFPELEIKSIWF